MEYLDINVLITKWQSQIVSIGIGHFSSIEARNILNKIIDEIIEHKEPILNGEISVANRALLFFNVSLYGSKYSADVAKLSFLAL